MKKHTAELAITPEILGLSDISIDSVHTCKNGSIHIKVSSTKKDILCSNCGKPTSPHGKGHKLCLRHLSVLGRKVFIEIQPPRGKCNDCDNNPTSTQTLDWFKSNGHQTKPYEDSLMLQLIGSTIADVAMKTDVGVKKLQNIVDGYKIDKVDWKPIKKIGLLGIDEIAKLKGHGDYVTLITSRYNGVNKIIGVIEGKKKTAIAEFLNSIPKNKRKTIAAVCVDMCDNYVDAVGEVLSEDIPIIVDRFHVVKLYRRSLDKLRSKELKRLKTSLSDAEYQALRPAIKILIAKKDCYSRQDKKILAPLFNLSPAIKAAYRLAREFTHIYNTHHRPATSERKINEWIEKVNTSDVKCLKKFAKTVNKYKKFINNYFIARDTSGWVEGINNKVKVIKRRCYGITNLKHFFQRIFLDLEGYDIFLPKQHVSVVC